MPQFAPLAYIDPASGSILLQLIIAAAIGSAVYLRNYLFAGLGLFTRKRAAGSTPAMEGSTAPGPEEQPASQERRAA